MLVSQRLIKDNVHQEHATMQLIIIFFVLVFSDAGVDLSKPVICMCSGGMSSCSLLLAAHLCGCPDTALYLVSYQ